MADRSIVINLVANTKGLSGGLNKGAADIKGFVGKMQSSMAAVQNLWRLSFVQAAIDAGRSIASFVKNNMDAIDNLTDLTDELGVSVESFQKLAYSAKLAGVEQEELGGALEKMLKAVGNGDDAFAELGLNVELLKKLDAAEMFSEIATAIDRLPTRAEKAAKTMAIFGRSSGKFLNMFDGGRDKLLRESVELRMMGGTFSRDQAEAVKRANDELDKFSFQLSALSNDMAIGLAPVVKDLAAGIRQTIADVKGLIGSVGGGVDLEPAEYGSMEFLKAAAINPMLALIKSARHGSQARQLQVEMDINREVARQRNRLGENVQPLAEGTSGIIRGRIDSRPMGGGAALRGSGAAYSIARQFYEFGKSNKDDAQAQQLRKMDETNRKLGEIKTLISKPLSTMGIS